MTHPLERRLARLEPPSPAAGESGARERLITQIAGVASRIPPGTPVDPDGTEKLIKFFTDKGWMQVVAILQRAAIQ